MSTVYVAEIEGQDLRLIKDGNPNVPYDLEVYPIYGHDDADRWLAKHGYTDHDNWGWRKANSSKPAIWLKNVVAP
ncbi:hypothetical protein ACWT_5857 [Actinoplanes sp. SE50]|uniref:hypothetical protein n=1 Tax=unclassified Actinoplanes TaxID=2626549 RepID=UPI00023EBDCD|nr:MULTISPECIES: hypothetical protein [unclassified Actinoplanes]AEV86875.1 hypothetical protein ACPL_5988 [Actinoplanes sp. SE50/110]ATO85272.1 hypothetical protein ACWT_5857 [Actinoplanes sp. SE50]SLM02682.1 hypothetical protein ACSP50_5964 [Actinoplanes sp. SE50/110]